MRFKQRTFLFATASLLLSMLLCLGVLEGSLRVYHRVKVWREWNTLPPVALRALIPSADPELIYEWSPGWRKDSFTVNSAGMADREIAMRKGDGVFRIAFTGDSISANFGYLPRPEIYLNVLGRSLDAPAQRGARFEMLNFGVNGYSLLQSARMLEARVSPFAPDLIVAQLCLNDPYPSSGPYAQRAAPGLSRLWDFVHLRIAPDHFWAWANVKSNYDQEGIANVKRGIARLAKIARRGPPVVAVLFPYLHAPAYENWGFRRLHEIYGNAAREVGLPLIDLYKPFRRAGLISLPPGTDAVHPGRAGHKLAAVEIQARLDGMQLLPRRAPQTPLQVGPSHEHAAVQ